MAASSTEKVPLPQQLHLSYRMLVVIDKGQIVEQGSHQQLMSAKGQYHALFSKQAEGYQN